MTGMRVDVYLDLEPQCAIKTRLVIKHKMIMCIPRIRVNQSHIANESINQSINHEVSYVGPPPKPIYFAWTKSVNSITRNYKIWFLLILKQFKKQGRWKLHAQRKNGINIWLKMWLLKPKISKDGRWGSWGYLRNWNLENHLKMGFRKIT